MTNEGRDNEAVAVEGDQGLNNGTSNGQAKMTRPDRNEGKQLMSPEEENTNEEPATDLLYSIDQAPPVYLAILLGFQHYLTMFGATVGIPFILAPLMCFEHDPNVLAQIMSTIFFCSGLVTLVQSTFGHRLPIIQGGTFSFIASTIAIMAERGKCPAVLETSLNATLNATTAVPLTDPEWKLRMREVQGAIIVSSLFQIVIGFSGLMGFVLKFIGPLTVAPTIALITLPLFDTAAYFAGAQWGVALLTMLCIGLFSQVLKEVALPMPRGARLFIFKLFPILFSIFIGWAVSAILTATDALAPGSAARTDYRSNVLHSAQWIRFPYPGQWGLPVVTTAGVFGMLAGVLASMIESIGDYYACARMAEAPPPPRHVINRGLGMEGIGCLLTGIWGTGNGTTSYSENIGAIGITRVGSVRVIQWGAVIMMVLSIIGKFGALFATIPNPVIGGIFVIMFGMIIAFGLSSLQFVDLNSMRNLFVLGVSFFFGMVLPSWVKGNPQKIDLGVDELNQIVRVLLMTNMAVGGTTGFILDNLLPGTKEERGLIKWQNNLTPDGVVKRVASVHVYDPPFIPKTVWQHRFCRYIPFLPFYEKINPQDTEMAPVEAYVMNPDRSNGLHVALRI